MQQNRVVLDRQNNINRTDIEMLSITQSLAFYSSELLEMQVNKQLSWLIAVNRRQSFQFF